jgi:hypothetical protein
MKSINVKRKQKKRGCGLPCAWAGPSGAVTLSPFHSGGFVETFISELQVLHKLASTTCGNAQAMLNQWIAPPQNIVKINVEAALLRNGSVAVVAAVCRDRTGIYIGASSITLVGISDPTIEAFAVQEALALADDLYERRIYVASDCKIVIIDIMQKSATVYGDIIQEIVDRSSLFTNYSFSHEFRRSNTEAHNLANHPLSLGAGRHDWLRSPTILFSCL